jgi:serine/threonine protein kinase
VDEPPRPDPELLVERLEKEGVDDELIDFIMRMLSLDPRKRISAKDALKHDWLVGPLLGYWAALGMEWTLSDESRKLPHLDEVLKEGAEKPLITSVEQMEFLSSPPKPKDHFFPILPRKLPPLLDLANLSDDEELANDNESDASITEISVSSSTKPIPFNNNLTDVDPDEMVQTLTTRLKLD